MLSKQEKQNFFNELYVGLPDKDISGRKERAFEYLKNHQGLTSFYLCDNERLYHSGYGRYLSKESNLDALELQCLFAHIVEQNLLNR